jgi:hypothetical protein
MGTPREEVSAVNELREIRKALQDAGLTLLQAATAAVGAAANDTLSATKAAIEAADDTLAAAQETVRKLRTELRQRG